MKIIINFVLLILVLLTSINLALASNSGVVGIVIFDSPSQEKNLVFEEDSNSQIQLTQAELREKYEQQELENDLGRENLVDEKITGASVIDLGGDSRTNFIFLIILMLILFLLVLLFWLIFH